ncbi:ACP S-malonyltransferase [Alteromonas sp. ASW11-36]|uniref:Malonyl CoA-acyl carrier protein transacylase n=1 Tax=Alteromonas arenosi TaxID=3055817 RepID=A0ABT7SX10_9ALTE|nr:ACP S-malonyltransferase [Alteromonas sp. ASW11-36]MDM7860728.1 ACP S-malonyltransferase [Alteromonas sp. ASW11-36]
MSVNACVFPGQGSQSVGMLAAMADEYPQIEQTFEEASASLGYDLWDLVQNDPDQQLNQTHVTQPALLTASVALWRVAQGTIGDVAYLAGHSLGEYSALVCAGAISLSDAVKLVEARGKFMQQAVPAGEGAMYAIIGLADDAIVQCCEAAEQETGGVVAPVNYNSPGQVVIAGASQAAELAANACKEAGAKRALPLAVSVPSHCALMKPAAEQLAALLDTINIAAPQIPVVNNVDVSVETSPDAIKDALVRQLYCPVRWTESVEYLAKQGVDTAFEVGPGKVLTGLIKRIDKSISASPMNEPAHFNAE